MKTSLRKKILTGAFFFAAFVVTGLVLFYSITSYLGRREWAEAKKALEARGENLSVEGLLPPALPDELNFFAAPAFAELADYELVENRGDLIPQPKVPVEGQMLTSVKTALGSPFHKGKKQSTESLTDLGVAAAYYRSEGRVSLSGQGQAEVVLEALEPGRAVLDEIALYAERPAARFPVRFEDGINAALPHVGPLLTMAKYLNLRAIAEMELGRNAVAAADVLLIFRLADSIKAEVVLISQLVRASVLATANQTIWEGIARGSWDAGQLAVFQERLRGYNLLSETADSLRGERAQMLSLMESALQKAELGNLLGTMAAVTSDRRAAWEGTVVASLYPRGWAYGDFAFMANVHQRWIDALDSWSDGIRPADFEFLDQEMVAWTVPKKIRHLLSSIALPAVSGVTRRAALIQAGLNEARAACALERYRLGTGDLPETLDMLVPEYLQEIPRDPMTNQPLKYRKIAADDFVLWSIGWDVVDDNAKPEDRKTKKGDWVWRRKPTQPSDESQP